MLQRTFCHIPGVGLGYERRLWDRGVFCWSDATVAPLAGKRADTIRRYAAESRAAFDAADARYFAARLPSREQWRLFPNFRRRAAFLDIETTGLGGPNDHVTTIVLYDGRALRHYVHGRNLEQFELDVAAYDLLVTYNGKTFDVPFLRRFLGLRLDQAHVDLRYVLHALGITGGLKGTERQLGLERPGMEHLDGYTAVLLWRMYRETRDDRVLQTLLAYNAQDVLSLEYLAVWACNQKLHDTPFRSQLALPPCTLADNPFHPDPQIVADVCHWSPGDLSLALGRD